MAEGGYIFRVGDCLQVNRNPRWLAPELLSAEDMTPSSAADVYVRDVSMRIRALFTERERVKSMSVRLLGLERGKG